MKKETTIWIVVPAFNRADKICSFINQILPQTFQSFKLIIVDHGTVDIDYSIFDDSRIVVLKENPELWWTGATNRGVKYVIKESISVSDFVLIINDDVHVKEDYLESLVDVGMNCSDAIIGSICINSETDKIIYAGFSLNKVRAKFVPKYSNCRLNQISADLIPSDVLPGRGVLIPFIVFKSMGFFNESQLPHYGADFEFFWRARKNGFELMTAANCQVFTQSKDDTLYRYKSSFKEFIANKKKPGNLPVVINFSFLCFSRCYAVYYIGINFIRHLLSYIKRFFAR